MRRGYAVSKNGMFMGAIAVGLLVVLMGIVAGAALGQTVEENALYPK
jgi:hypothetical protein